MLRSLTVDSLSLPEKLGGAGECTGAERAGALLDCLCRLLSQHGAFWKVLRSGAVVLEPQV